MKSTESELNERSQERNILITGGNGHNLATGRDKTTGHYIGVTPDQTTEPVGAPPSRISPLSPTQREKVPHE